MMIKVEQFIFIFLMGGREYNRRPRETYAQYDPYT